MSDLQPFHIVCDGHMPDASKRTRADVANWCEDVITAIQMTCIHGPVTEIAADGTLIGFAIIAESHLAAHITPDGHCFAEAFSCKAFDAMKFASITIDAFGLVHPVQVRMMPRSQGEPLEESSVSVAVGSS